MSKYFLSSFVVFFLFLNNLFADIVQDQMVRTSTDIIKIFNQDYNGSKRHYKLPKRFKKDRIKAVAIIPDLIKSGVIATVQKGEGIFMIKGEDGQWSNPLFVDIKGLSLGMQGGFVSHDAILLFDNQRSYSGIFKDARTIEVQADASIFGGNGVRHITDAPELSANIYALGRSSGVFLGMSLGKSILKVHDQNNIDYYQRLYLVKDILNGSPKDSKYTKDLKNALNATFNVKNDAKTSK